MSAARRAAGRARDCVLHAAASVVFSVTLMYAGPVAVGASERLGNDAYVRQGRDRIAIVPVAHLGLKQS